MSLLTTLNAVPPQVDTQGWEPQVFEGALKLITNYKVTYIVFELAPYILCNAGRSPVEVINMLNCLGYVCFDGPWMKTHSKNKYAKTAMRGFSMRTNPPSRESFETWAAGVIGYTDLVCCKPDDIGVLLEIVS